MGDVDRVHINSDQLLWWYSTNQSNCGDWSGNHGLQIVLYIYIYIFVINFNALNITRSIAISFPFVRPNSCGTQNPVLTYVIQLLVMLYYIPSCWPCTPRIVCRSGIIGVTWRVGAKKKFMLAYEGQHLLRSQMIRAYLNMFEPYKHNWSERMYYCIQEETVYQDLLPTQGRRRQHPYWQRWDDIGLYFCLFIFFFSWFFDALCKNAVFAVL
jgi:hypothetical protein